MKTKLTAVVLSMTCFVMMSAFVGNSFQKNIGESNCYEEGYSIIPMDSTYVVSAAYNCNGAANNWRSWLMLLDHNGEILEQGRDLPVNGFVRKTLDNNLIFLAGNEAGLTYDTIKIIKADIHGNMFWVTSVFYPVCKNTVTDIYSISDGYLVTGMFASVSCSNPMYDSFIMKLDLNGNIVWEQTVSGDMNDQLHSIQEAPNGDILAYGFTNTKTAAKGTQHWLVRLTANGQLKFSKTYGDNTNNYGYDLEATPDNGALLAGYGSDIEVIKVDKYGNVEWQGTYGQHCGGQYFKIEANPDGGYALLASESLNGECTSALIKLDIDGNVLWKKNWNARLRDFAVKTDGSFALTGYAGYLPNIQIIVFDSTQFEIEETSVDTFEVNTTNQDVQEILDSMGISTSVDETTMNEKYPEVKIYPNPADRMLFLEFANPKAVEFTLEIYDMNGQLITYQDNIRSNKYLFERGNLVNGAYIYKLRGDGNVYAGRFMLQ